MTTWALIVAAGSGSRFGGAKQFADLAGRPVLEWSLEVARRATDGVVVVVPPDTAGTWDADLTVPGGASRSESVRNGLDALPADADIVAVHDAARPLAPEQLWRAVIDAVKNGAQGAIPSTPITDTVKKVTGDGHLVTLDRSDLVAVQTPQAFRVDALKDAHRSGADATDDAALVEAAGGHVVLIDGPLHNIKITSPTDLLLASTLLGARS